MNSQSLPTLYLCRPRWSRSQGQWVLEAKTHGGSGEGRGPKNVCYTAPLPAPVPISFTPVFLWRENTLRSPALSSPASRGLPEVGWGSRFPRLVPHLALSCSCPLPSLRRPPEARALDSAGPLKQPVSPKAPAPPVGLCMLLSSPSTPAGNNPHPAARGLCQAPDLLASDSNSCAVTGR